MTMGDLAAKCPPWLPEPGGVPTRRDLNDTTALANRRIRQQLVECRGIPAKPSGMERPAELAFSPSSPTKFGRNPSPDTGGSLREAVNCCLGTRR